MRPGALPLDVDGYPVAPPELELEQVHLYIRHGASLSPISWCVVALMRTSTTLRFLRRAYPGTNTNGRTTSVDPRKLDALPYGAKV